MKPELLKEIALIKHQISLLEDYVLPKDVSYSNIVFRDKDIPDKVNRALLDDINLAASKGNVVVTIGAIKSKHPKGKNNDPSTRHTFGNAVDIPIINGKAVRKEIKSEVEKFTNQLENLGYTKNKEKEGNQQKAFLTFGFPGHDDHVHVSNKTETPSQSTDPQGTDPQGAESQNSLTQGSLKQPEPSFNLDAFSKGIQYLKDPQKIVTDIFS
jgi:hypothetical protein